MGREIIELTGDEFLKGSVKAVGYIGIMKHAVLDKFDNVVWKDSYIGDATSEEYRAKGLYQVYSHTSWIVERGFLSLFGSEEETRAAIKRYWENDIEMAKRRGGQELTLEEVIIAVKKVEYLHTMRFV